MELSKNEILNIKKLEKQVKYDKVQLYAAFGLTIMAFVSILFKQFFLPGCLSSIFLLLLSLISNQTSKELLRAVIEIAKKDYKNMDKI